MITTLVEGLAQWLSDRDLADYKPVEPYAPTDRAVTIKRLPTTPDTSLAIYPYNTDDATTLPGTEVSIQLRFRGPASDRLYADRWADKVAKELHWRHHFNLGDVRIQRSQRVVTVPLGADDNGREERADSYTFLLM